MYGRLCSVDVPACLFFVLDVGFCCVRCLVLFLGVILFLDFSSFCWCLWGGYLFCALFGFVWVGVLLW